jgi:hypothetical protein
VKQESIPWQSFVFDAVWSSTIRNTSLGPCSTGIPACVFQGLGDGDFHFLTTRRSRSVSKLALIRGGRNLGLNVIFRGAGPRPAPNQLSIRWALFRIFVCNVNPRKRQKVMKSDESSQNRRHHI